MIESSLSKIGARIFFDLWKRVFCNGADRHTNTQTHRQIDAHCRKWTDSEKFKMNKTPGEYFILITTMFEKH